MMAIANAKTKTKIHHLLLFALTYRKTRVCQNLSTWDNLTLRFHCTGTVLILYNTKFRFKSYYTTRRGGYLGYLSNGDVPFLRVLFSLIFLKRGIKRRQFFWSRLSKGEILLDRVAVSSYFFVLEYVFYQFFLEWGIISGQKFWSWVKKISSWPYPRTNSGRVIPPLDTAPQQNG